MKMKNRLLYSLLIPLLLTVACQDAGPEPVTGDMDGTRMRIQVRNLDTEDLQVLVFDARAPKAIETYFPAGSGSEGWEIRTGEKIIACVLNGPDLSGVADFNALQQWHYVPGESDDAPASPLRFGYTRTRVSADTHTLSLDAALQTGRIVLRSVSNRLDGRQTVESLHAYIANAAGDNLLDAAYLESAVCIHPDGAAGADDFSERTDLSLGALPYGSVHTGPYLFISCPTPPSWSPWLILSARIGGRDWYYNIPLGSIAKGKSQEVSVALRTLGADFPCTDNEPGSYEIYRSIADWTPLSCEETI